MPVWSSLSTCSQPSLRRCPAARPPELMFFPSFPSLVCRQCRHIKPRYCSPEVVGAKVSQRVNFRGTIAHGYTVLGLSMLRRQVMLLEINWLSKPSHRAGPIGLVIGLTICRDFLGRPGFDRDFLWLVLGISTYKLHWSSGLFRPLGKLLPAPFMSLQRGQPLNKKLFTFVNTSEKQTLTEPVLQVGRRRVLVLVLELVAKRDSFFSFTFRKTLKKILFFRPGSTHFFGFAS